MPTFTPTDCLANGPSLTTGPIELDAIKRPPQTTGQAFLPPQIQAVLNLSCYRAASSTSGGASKNKSAIVGGTGNGLATRNQRLLQRESEFQSGRKCASRALQLAINASTNQPSAAAQTINFQASASDPHTNWMRAWDQNATEPHGELSPSGTDAIEVGRNPDRTPQWPPGFTGSISHSQRWVWAAVTATEHYRSLGIDTEVMASPDQVASLWNQIGSDREWEILTASLLSRCQAFTLLFSAKEAFYKCWYPITGEYLDFSDVRLQSFEFQRTEQTKHAAQGRVGSVLTGRVQLACQPDVLDRMQNRRLSTGLIAMPVMFQLNPPDVFTWTGCPPIANPSLD